VQEAAILRDAHAVPEFETYAVRFDLAAATGVHVGAKQS